MLARKYMAKTVKTLDKEKPVMVATTTGNALD